MSPSVVHRLETASGPVTVMALYRFAEVLEVPVKQLFEFSGAAAPAASSARERGRKIARLIPLDSPRLAKEAYKTLLPVYSLRAAAGYFGAGQTVEPEGWLEVKARKSGDKKLFVARAKGSSMEPLIKDGDLLLFRAHPEGTRQGKIVLAQYRGPADPDTGGSYTVKKYSSAKTIRGEGEGEWQHQKITLSPLNPDYDPIELSPRHASDFAIVAEFVDVL